MRWTGGYPYPVKVQCAVLSIIAIGGVIAAWWSLSLHPLRAVVMLFVAEGSVLWATSLTPVGSVRPPDRFWGKVAWVFSSQRQGMTVALNHRLFYAGILLVVAGTVLSGFVS